MGATTAVLGEAPQQEALDDPVPAEHAQLQWIEELGIRDIDAQAS